MILFSARGGAVWNTTTSKAALNLVCLAEVMCWYCVGEIIGKKSIVGYNVWLWNILQML